MFAQLEPLSWVALFSDKNPVIEKPWVALFSDNRHKDLGSELRFVPLAVSNGQRVARFHLADVKQQESRWRNTLVSCVYGLQPRLERLSFLILL